MRVGLFGYALKFTAAGRTVTLGSRLQDNEALLWVEDTGVGIPADELLHVFDPREIQRVFEGGRRRLPRQTTRGRKRAPVGPYS